MGLRDPSSPPWEGDRDRRRSDLGCVALNHPPTSSLLPSYHLLHFSISPFVPGFLVGNEITSGRGCFVDSGFGVSFPFRDFLIYPALGIDLVNLFLKKPLYLNRMASNAMTIRFDLCVCCSGWESRLQTVLSSWNISNC
uniref:Uncharacterized protein n=1 Tax=Fagus sylvatica TaxID=28930 RepID=A0A2N9FUG1_FAGSY